MEISRSCCIYTFAERSFSFSSAGAEYGVYYHLHTESLLLLVHTRKVTKAHTTAAAIFQTADKLESALVFRCDTRGFFFILVKKFNFLKGFQLKISSLGEN